MENKPLAVLGGIALLAIGLVLGFIIQSGMGGDANLVQEDVRAVSSKVDTLTSEIQQAVEKINQASQQTSQSETRIIANINKATSERHIFGIEGAPSKGKSDAPVTILEFSDFQCPYCSKMGLFLIEMVKKYPNDLRVVFVDLPLFSAYKDGFPFHPYAMLAHETAAEAQAQGKFWQMYEYIFTNQRALFPGRPKDQADYDAKLLQVREKLVAQAGAIGMDVDKLNQALDSQAHRKMLDGRIELSRKLGVRGTPSLFVNSYIKVGDPSKEIPSYIEEAKSNR